MGNLTKRDIEEAMPWLHAKADEYAEKITPLYPVLQWKWAGIGVPKLEDVKRTLHELINDLIHGPPDRKRQETFCSTGGLKVFVRLSDEFINVPDPPAPEEIIGFHDHDTFGSHSPCRTVSGFQFIAEITKYGDYMVGIAD